MKIKRRNILFAVLVIIICSSMKYNGNRAAAEEEKSKVPDASSIVVSDLMEADSLVITPGETKHIVLPIKAIGGYMSSANISVKPEKSDAPFAISKVILSEKGNGVPFYAVSNFGNTYAEFEVRVNETAKIGNYPITVAATAINADTGNAYTNQLQLSLQVLKELSPAQITVSDVQTKEVTAGCDTDIKFKIKNEGEITARSTYISLKYGETNITPKYSTPKIRIGEMPAGKEQYMTLPVSVLSTATEGLKTITVTSEYKNSDGAAGTDSHDLFIKVKKNEDAANLVVKSVSYDTKLVPGSKANMTLNLKNKSDEYFQDVSVKIDDAVEGYAAEGIIKNYYDDSVWAGYIEKGKSLKVKIPFIVSKQATGGLKKVSLIITYLDKHDVKHTINTKVYPDIIAGSSKGSKSNIVISNVQQSPEAPVAGEYMEVSFDIQNKSKVAITELKLKLNELTGSTFIPVRSDPYIYIAKLAGGAKRRITIPLTVSDKIPDGMSNLTLQYSYSDNAAGETAIIPIRDVQNDLGSNSKPKLIIKYKTRPEELKAGSEFAFTFDLYNTNSSVPAKNITVTLSQADNIFSVVQGANNLFIDRIAPEKSARNTLKFKVKSDATTKAYPLKATIEYEYPGMKANPTTGITGETTTMELNLMVVENARPKIDYVDVSSWEGAVVKDTPATLYFDFYNMGKSKLNNVIASMEGDFKKTDGDMKFIGNVEPGASVPVDFEVIPKKEGEARGILKISYEDSNGDKQEYTKKFESTVDTATALNTNKEKEMKEAMSKKMVKAKKAILPLWAFVLLLLAIFAIFVPVTRAVIIKSYKSKVSQEDLE